MLTIITVVSAGIVCALILPLIIMVTRNKTKRKQKRPSKGDIENTRRSTASKIYAEIDDDTLLPSCSVEDTETSQSNGKAGEYEKLVDIQTTRAKGSCRGSYAHLDEATKGANTGKNSGVRYHPLGDTVTIGKDDYRLNESFEDKDCDRLHGRNAQDIRTNGPEITEQKAMRRETKDYDKPPPRHVQRGEANPITAPGNNNGVDNQEIPLVLSMTDAIGRRMITDSYDVPPVRKMKHDAAADYDVPPTNTRNANIVTTSAEYDVPPKINTVKDGSMGTRVDYDIPPAKK